MIYLTGDTHGDIGRFEKGKARKLKKGDYIIVCGDFGFLWDNSEEEQKNLLKLSKKKYTILFLDGLNENFDILNSYPVENFCGGKVHKIKDNIYHLCRGEIFNIENNKFFVFGGGEPDDIGENSLQIREKQLPSSEDMENALVNLKNEGDPDYIITHFPCPSVKKYGEPFGILDNFFLGLLKSTRYKCWFFGSMHINRRYTSRCICLFDDIIPIS